MQQFSPWIAGFPGLIWSIDIPHSRLKVFNRWSIPGLDVPRLLKDARYRKKAVRREDYALLMEFWDMLTARRPAAVTAEDRRAAIAALLQIDGDRLTPAAIDRTIRGCGIRARALEMGGGQLRVIFPEVAGEPEDFDQIRKIILDILPCHLEVEFYFRYLTWAECEAAGYTWGQVEAAEYTWESFQLAVPPER